MNAAQSVHVDDHAIWIDPNDGERWVIGMDGGIAITYDRGGNFWYPRNLPIGQFYDVSFDYAVPYNVCSGAQDNGAWCGPSRRRSTPINNTWWFTISGGDGFYTAQDPTDPNMVWGEIAERRHPADESQDGRARPRQQADVERPLSHVGRLDRDRARRSAPEGNAGDGEENRGVPRRAEERLGRSPDSLQLGIAVLPLAAQPAGLLPRRQPSSEVTEAW